MKNRKNEQREKLGKNRPFRSKEGFPRRGEAEGPKRLPLGLAAA